jgi:hypothetical protein
MTCTSGTSYIVKAGDTLFLIAQQQLGDGNLWPEIKNPDGSSPKPNDLQVGQELCLPIIGSGQINIDQVDFTQYAGGGSINAWISEALSAAGLPNTAGWTNGFLTLCMRESSYNPNAVNTTDGNATGPIVGDGNPEGCSRGVAQCIPSTFAYYHVAGSSVFIYDPVANIAAASAYVRDVYGVSEDGSDFAAKVQQADPNRPPHGYMRPTGADRMLTTSH